MDRWIDKYLFIYSYAHASRCTLVHAFWGELDASWSTSAPATGSRWQSSRAGASSWWISSSIYFLRHCCSDCIFFLIIPWYILHKFEKTTSFDLGARDVGNVGKEPCLCSKSRLFGRLCPGIGAADCPNNPDTHVQSQYTTNGPSTSSNRRSQTGSQPGSQPGSPWHGGVSVCLGSPKAVLVEVQTTHKPFHGCSQVTACSPWTTGLVVTSNTGFGWECVSNYPRVWAMFTCDGRACHARQPSTWWHPAHSRTHDTKTSRGCVVYRTLGQRRWQTCSWLPRQGSLARAACKPSPSPPQPVEVLSDTEPPLVDPQTLPEQLPDRLSDSQNEPMETKDDMQPKETEAGPQAMETTVDPEPKKTSADPQPMDTEPDACMSPAPSASMPPPATPPAHKHVGEALRRVTTVDLENGQTPAPPQSLVAPESPGVSTVVLLTVAGTVQPVTVPMTPHQCKLAGLKIANDVGESTDTNQSEQPTAPDTTVKQPADDDDDDDVGGGSNLSSKNRCWRTCTWDSAEVRNVSWL